jgi:hypothetical protein
MTRPAFALAILLLPACGRLPKVRHANPYGPGRGPLLPAAAFGPATPVPAGTRCWL